MMPAVNGWHAAFAALLFLTPRVSLAAEDLPGAAKELARKTVSFAGGRVAVGAYRNISSLPDSDLAQVRREFEAALTGGVTAAVDVRITLSENASQYLLVEEARKGEDTQVWIAGWPRSSGGPVSGLGVTIDKKLLWEQDEPILDAAVLESSVLVLSPSQISLYTQRQLQQAAPIAGRAWPRDLRGRLRLNGGHLKCCCLVWSAPARSNRSFPSTAGRVRSPGYWNQAAGRSYSPSTAATATISTGT
jgi:hypothetical protein